MGATVQAARREKKKNSAGVRCAVRFPLYLPVRLICAGKVFEGRTENMSASGVLLRMNTPLAIGDEVEFLVEIPSGTLGFEQTGAVHCAGRVARAYEEDGFAYAGIVIDEYSFR
jgi:hypothetical protein